MRARRLVVLAAVVMTVTTANIATSAAPGEDVAGEPGVMTRVSRGLEGQESNGDSYGPVMSADGRFVAFSSTASNLVEENTNSRGEIFLWDRLAEVTERVSVGHNGAEPDEASWDPAVSANGRFVAFTSPARNLTERESDSMLDVFVRDMWAGETRQVTVALDGGVPNNESSSPAISAHGRYVAFASDARNLVPGGGKRGVFVWNRKTEVIKRVGRGSLEANPDMSANGRYVTWDTGFSLVRKDTNNWRDVYVWDRVSGVTRLASIGLGGVAARCCGAGGPSISSDGRYVAFHAGARNLVRGDTNRSVDVFVRDLVTGTTRRVSITPDGQQMDFSSFRPSVSADGRYVAYFAEGVEGLISVFVRDRELKTTQLVSVGIDGEPATGVDPSHPGMSGDGMLIAFASTASNVVPGDTNGFYDVFVRSPPKP
jgi:Tol biopolymer transport system component